MLRPRLIPCLLVHQNGLVKTVKFKDHKYIGDPINSVRIFNEKTVDELIVLDIDASINNCVPNMSLIQKLAQECNMPLCYGGGIRSVSQAMEIINLGVEKIAISASAFLDRNLIATLAKMIGSQSIVVIIDAKKKLFGDYECYIHNGTKKMGISPTSAASMFEAEGAGEIVINSIDQDGAMTGYDFNLIDKIRNAVNLPITILGGLGDIADIRKAINKYKILGVAGGSYFVFKGKYKAVLISYPNLNLINLNNLSTTN